MQCAFSALSFMKSNKRSYIKIAQDVTIHHNKCVGDARISSSKRDCTCSIKRFWLDRIVQLHAGTHPIGKRFKEWLWLETKRKSNMSNSSGTEMRDEMFELANICNWQ
jgi:hypothetical protein